jgi:hypothetical protein
MCKNLLRRIEKLEHGSTLPWESRLRALARRWDANEEAYLQAALGHERELCRELIEDGITWQGFLLLRDWLNDLPAATPTTRPRKPRPAVPRRNDACEPDNDQRVTGSQLPNMHLKAELKLNRSRL